MHMLRLTRRLIRKNPVSFFLQQRAYERNHRANQPEDVHRNVLDTLLDRGICVLRGYFEPSRIETLRDEASQAMSRIRSGDAPPDTTTSRYPEFGTYVLHHAEHVLPSSRSFMENNMIRNIANAYVGGSAVSFDLRAELRSEAKKNALVDDWHRDTWKHRFKAFLYLEDVTEDQAPLRYLAGSHTGDHWRARCFWLDYVRHTFDSPAVNRYVARSARRQCGIQHSNASSVPDRRAR